MLSKLATIASTGVLALQTLSAHGQSIGTTSRTPTDNLRWRDYFLNSITTNNYNDKSVNDYFTVHASPQNAEPYKTFRRNKVQPKRGRSKKIFHRRHLKNTFIEEQDQERVVSTYVGPKKFPRFPRRKLKKKSPPRKWVNDINVEVVNGRIRIRERSCERRCPTRAEILAVKKSDRWKRFDAGPYNKECRINMGPDGPHHQKKILECEVSSCDERCPTRGEIMAVKKSDRWKRFDAGPYNKECRINMGPDGPHHHKKIKVCDECKKGVKTRCPTRREIMAVERSKRWEIFDSVTNRGCHINMGHHGPHSHKTVEVCTTDDESSN